jgi:PAS domain S-box-containing protein
VSVPFELSKTVRWVRLGAANRSAIWRYGFAVVAVIAATEVRLAFHPIVGAHAPYLPFNLAVILAAWFGGLGPGLAAVALSAFSADWFFLEPLHSHLIASPEAFWGFTLFVVTTLLTALLVGSLRELFTAMARAEESLRRHAQLIDLAHDAIITTDSDRRIVTWNKGAEQMYGWSEREAAGKVLHELLQTSGPIGTGEIDAILGQSRQWNGELSHTGRDSQRLAVESRQVLIRDNQPLPASILEINRDITGRKQAEEALRKSHYDEFARATELRAVMDAMPVAMLISRDPECRYITGNSSAYRLLREPPGSNLSKSAIEGKQPAYRVTQDGKEIPPNELPLQKAGATGQGDYDHGLELVFPDGSRANIIGNAVPLLDIEGRTRGAVGVFVDITERKQTEERLRQAQKLESISLLAGGIAHDFNNLLTVIIGNASFAINKHPSSEEIQHIIAASEQAAHLTKQLLAYTGKAHFISKTFSLTDLVSGCMERLSASVPRRVELRSNLSPEELLIKGDPSQIEQILMNLVVNAGEAIPPQTEGRIEIGTSDCGVTPETVAREAQSFDVQPGRFVCLEVTDNGTGMDEATLPRIFDPFFSTKFKGRGLGLAAAQGIVRSCHGFIDVHSSRGAGSTFRVFLPASAEKPAAAIPAVARPDSSRTRDHRRASVLVVDDEEMVRQMACVALRTQGYEVLEAKNGKDAIEMLAGAAAMPSLVLLDLTMPVMGGDELVPILNRDYPGMPVILTSGYLEEDARREFPPGAVADFLQKPYALTTLTEKVEGILNSGGPDAEAPA